MIKFFDDKDYVVVDFCAFSYLNSLDEVILNKLEKIINGFEDELSSKVIVFRGLSDGNHDNPYPINFDYCRRWEKILLRINRLPAITIAIVNGTCMRFSLQLALVCDFRIATIGAVFVSSEIQEGYLPGMGVFLLAKYVGIGVARRILFTGMPVKLTQAKRFGLVDQSCSVDNVDNTISEFVKKFDTVNVRAITLSRRLLTESFCKTYEESIGNFLAAQRIYLNQLEVTGASDKKEILSEIN